MVESTKNNYSTPKCNFYSKRSRPKVILFDSVHNSNELLLPWEGTAVPPWYLGKRLDVLRSIQEGGQEMDQNCVKKIVVWKPVPAIKLWPGFNTMKEH